MVYPERPQDLTAEASPFNPEDVDDDRIAVYDTIADMGVMTGSGKFFRRTEPEVSWDFLLVTPLDIGRPQSLRAHRLIFNHQTYDVQRRKYSLGVEDYILLPRKTVPVVWVASSIEVDSSSPVARHKNPTAHSAPLIHPYPHQGSYGITSGAQYDCRLLERALDTPDESATSLLTAAWSLDVLKRALQRFSGAPGEDVLQLYEKALHNSAA